MSDDGEARWWLCGALNCRAPVVEGGETEKQAHANTHTHLYGVVFVPLDGPPVAFVVMPLAKKAEAPRPTPLMMPARKKIQDIWDTGGRL